MQEYFKNLSNEDPLFQMLVRMRLKQIEQRTHLNSLTVDNLTELDELAILRQYCTMIHKEYLCLKSFILQNAQLTLRAGAVQMSS